MVAQSTFEQQIAGGVGRVMVLLGIMIQVLVLVREIETRHFPGGTLPYQVDFRKGFISFT